ncbi:MAG TPA: AraC family ligand binding domain-containing protein [Phycisphaerales bacterium]|nr:AraC family ligand binding domain-containing protein [Phycisphaerales bacterium]
MEEPNTGPSSGVPESERLRQHPAERFAAPQHHYNLHEVATRLGREAEAGQAGHRQETLYKHGATTVALFLFGHLTRLPAHRAGGVVVIQVLEGHIQVTAEDRAHDLHAGHLLALAPGVEHDVLAREVSRMLLTVHLDADAANRSE